jgi:hypothetical protein
MLREHHVLHPLMSWSCFCFPRVVQDLMNQGFGMDTIFMQTAADRAMMKQAMATGVSLQIFHRMTPFWGWPWLLRL